MTARTAVAVFLSNPSGPSWVEEAMKAHAANGNVLTADPSGSAEPLTVNGMRFCRECGCTEFDACTHPEHGNCWWVGPNLCSHCANGWGDQNGR